MPLLLVLLLLLLGISKYIPRLLGVAQNPLASLVVYTPLEILPGSVEVR
jgi:hypothetical protein